MPETNELDPEQLAQWTAFADDFDAEKRVRTRRARRRYRLQQALWTGIAAVVILGYVSWSLWP